MKCPKCNCEDIAITVQYRKSTICHLIKFFLIIAIFATIILNMAEVIQFDELDKVAKMSYIATTTNTLQGPAGYTIINPTGPILSGLTIALIFCEIIKICIERKKRIYYVCKQCKEIWYEQDEL